MIEFRNQEEFEKILTHKEFKKIKLFFTDISVSVGNFEDLLTEVKKNKTLTYFENVKKKVNKHLIKKKIKPLIPIFKKLIVSPEILRKSFYIEDKTFEYNFIKIEILLEEYLKSFKKEARPKLFLLVAKFMVDYFHLTHSNLVEASSFLNFEKSKTFEEKSKNFLDSYAVLAENVYQRLIKFFLNCEYIRNNKTLKDNRQTGFKNVLKNLNTELKIKKYKLFILDNSVLIRNAKSHGHRKFLIFEKKLELWDNDGSRIILNQLQMEREFEKMLALAFNNNVLMIFLNYLHRILLEEKIFNVIMNNLEDLVLNMNDEMKLKAIFEQNDFFKEVEKVFVEVFSLNLK